VLHFHGVDFVAKAMVSTGVHASPKLKFDQIAAWGAAFQ
jgi:hypothetical protein